MTNTKLEFHPIANLFPLLNETETDALASDIAENGQMYSIILYEGKILDGRNRYVACTKIGVKPRCVEFSSGDPLNFVVSTNLHRRHLNESQRAMIAAKLANMTVGKPKKYCSYLNNMSQTNAAKQLKVSRHSVVNATKVVNAAVPEVVQAVESGKLAVSVAATLAEAPHTKQREVIAKDDKKAILAASKEIRQEMATERRKKRTTEIAAAVCNNKPLDGSLGTFAVLYADPAWQYDSSESDSRVVENQYPTMPLDEICGLDVNSIAHNDAVLFLWTTSPKLQEAFQVLDAWGFEYRTCAVWDKEKIGMGYYFRQQHELLLVATWGNIPAPAAANRFSSIIRAKRGKHSQKPEIVYEIIEAMYPQLPKIELFARKERSGWSKWGNQT